MDTRPCSFCSHENPEDAKFCNACGSSMHLQLCRQCGAIDNMSAIACYKCGAPFSSVEGGNAQAAGAAGARAADAEAEPRAGPQPAEPAPKSPPLTAPARSSRLAKALAFALVAGVAVVLYRMYGPELTEDGPGATLVHDAARASPDVVDAMLGVIPRVPAVAPSQVSPIETPAPDAPPPSPDVTPAAQEAPPDATDVLVEAPPPEHSVAPPIEFALPPENPATPPPADMSAHAPPSPAPGEGPAGCSPAVDALGLCD